MHISRKRRWTLVGAGAATGLTAGLILGGLGVAGAANSPSTPTSTAAAPSTSGSQQPSFPDHGTPAHEDQEKAVTGDAATKAQAAAIKNVGSGTAGAVTTDFNGSGYEVTVTKPDGTQVEVHLDSSFNAVQGGPGHPGGPGRPNDNDADDTPVTPPPA